jgi:anti-sigma factor RsiW
MTTSDIFWTAFRYVHGELNADEALAFELALETDQAAREAVARVVELGEAVRAVVVVDAASAESVIHPAPAVTLAGADRRAWSATGWALAAVAASIALAVWLDPGRMASGPAPGAQQATSPEADDSGRLLAQAWVEVNAEFAAEQSVAASATGAAEADLVEASFGGDPAAEYSDPMGLEPVYRADDGSELPAPDWLVSAVVDTPAGTVPEVPSATEVP